MDLLKLTVDELPSLLYDLTQRITQLEAKAARTTNTERLTLNPEQAAKILHLSRSRVYVLCGEGKLPSHKVGNRLLFYSDELENFIRSNRRIDGRDSAAKVVRKKKTDAL